MPDPRPDDHRNPLRDEHGRPIGRDLKPDEFGVRVPIVEDEPETTWGATRVGCKQQHPRRRGHDQVEQRTAEG